MHETKDNHRRRVYPRFCSRGAGGWGRDMNEMLLYIIVGIAVLAAIVIIGLAQRAPEGENEIQQIFAEAKEAATMPAETPAQEYIKEVEPPHPLKQKRLAGTYKLSFYTPAPDENGGYSVTATGFPLDSGVGWICAANKKDFPLGTLLYIPGYGYRTVCDTGCRKGVIDVLVGDKETAFRLGVVEAEVYVVEAMQ